MTGAPLHYQWTGEALIPLGRHKALARERFEPGHIYRMEPIEERSDATHKHEFAWLKDAWLNLPERLGSHPMTISPEHLRKHALIATGWCDVRTYYCTSAAEARRWANYLRPDTEFEDISVSGTTVVRKTAKSQSYRAMGKKDFQASKSAIMDYIAALIEVTAGEMEKVE